MTKETRVYSLGEREDGIPTFMFFDVVFKQNRIDKHTSYLYLDETFLRKLKINYINDDDGKFGNWFFDKKNNKKAIFLTLYNTNSFDLSYMEVKLIEKETHFEFLKQETAFLNTVDQKIESYDTKLNLNLQTYPNIWNIINKECKDIYISYEDEV